MGKALNHHHSLQDGEDPKEGLDALDLNGPDLIEESTEVPYDSEAPVASAEILNDEKKAKSSYLPAATASGLDSFIREVNRCPMLEEEDERALARRLRDYGDLDAARKLVMSHLRLVVSIARGYLGYGLPLSDLIQEGNIGLMKAVRHFDPEVGGRLAAFAVHWIKAEIHDYVIRNWRMVKVATTKAQRKLFFNLRHNKKHLGWLSEKEKTAVADTLGVNVSDVAEMESRLSGQDIGFDLEAEDSSTAVSGAAPVAYLEDESSDFALHFEDNDYKSYELKKLKEALDSLDERSRLIVKKRWLDDSKSTLQDLAGELKISVERVRQIENAALKKIKDLLVVTDESGLMALEYKEVKEAKKPAPKKRGRRKAS